VFFKQAATLQMSTVIIQLSSYCHRISTLWLLLFICCDSGGI